MLPRKERRFPMGLPVRVWGTGKNRRPFLLRGMTLDVSRLGARLDIAAPGEPGLPVGIQHAKQQGQFQVAWVGQKETPVEGQVGITGAAPGHRFWGVTLSGSAGTNGASANPPAGSAVAPLPSLSSVWKGSEQRRAARLPCTHNVLVLHKGGHFPLSGKLADIGSLGCYVETDMPLPLETILNLVFTGTESEFRAAGIVRLLHPSIGMGVEFHEMTTESRRQFEHLIQSLAGDLRALSAHSR